jgi:hypothetical protein
VRRLDLEVVRDKLLNILCSSIVSLLFTRILNFHSCTRRSIYLSTLDSQIVLLLLNTRWTITKACIAADRSHVMTNLHGDKSLIIMLLLLQLLEEWCRCLFIIAYVSVIILMLLLQKSVIELRIAIIVEQGIHSVKHCNTVRHVVLWPRSSLLLLLRCFGATQLILLRLLT